MNWKLLVAFLILLNGPLFAEDIQPIQIQVIDAHVGGIVKVRVQNISDKPVNLWGGGSWAWGNWTFEFFNGNDLILFVRKPDEGFTVNIANAKKIPSHGSLDLTFDLHDESWVSHHIPISPTYPSKEDEKNWIKGCFAIFAIPPSEDAKTYGIWTGMVASPLY